MRGRWRNVAEPRLLLSSSTSAPPDYNGWRAASCRHRPVDSPESGRQQLTKGAKRPKLGLGDDRSRHGPGTGGPLGPYWALAAAWWDTVGPPPGPWLVMPLWWWWPHWAGPPLWAQVMPSSERKPIPILLTLLATLAPPIAGQHNPSLRLAAAVGSENKTRCSYYKRLHSLSAIWWVAGIQNPLIQN